MQIIHKILYTILCTKNTCRGRAGKMGRVGKTARRPCRENHKSCDADFLAQTSHDVT